MAATETIVTQAAALPFRQLIQADIAARSKLSQGETLLAIGDDTWTRLIDQASDAAEIGTLPIDKQVQIVADAARALNLSVLKLREDAAKCSADFLLRRITDEQEFIEIRVAVIGNVDAGKSTVLGVLTHATLDNGRGLARQRLFRHRHELESGRTSAVGGEILGFDVSGDIVNKPSHVAADKIISATALNAIWQRVCRESSKIISFVDLAGHEKYLKTTVFGMTGRLPDFCMLIVGSNQGVVGMSKEHLGLAIALNVPVFVVVTKIDMCPKKVLSNTMKSLKKILKSPGIRKMPLVIQDADDVIMAAHNFHGERICPIFQISNVTGHNLDLLKTFLNMLTSRQKCLANMGGVGEVADDKVEVLLDDAYSVPGVGTVVAGTILSGVIRPNTSMMIGPDPLGKFSQCDVKTLHRRRMPVDSAQTSQTVAAAVRKVKRSSVRQGQVLISKSALEQYRIPDVETPMYAAWDFLADVVILHHPTTIRVKYQPVVHIGAVRQTAVIKWMDKGTLRTGDRGRVQFGFMRMPELVRVGQKFVFREGRTKAVGTVVKVLPTQRGEKEKQTIGRTRVIRQLASTAVK